MAKKTTKKTAAKKTTKTTKKATKPVKKLEDAVIIEETSKGVYSMTIPEPTPTAEVVETAPTTNPPEQAPEISKEEIIQENASYNNAIMPRSDNDNTILYIGAILGLIIICWMLIV